MRFRDSSLILLSYVLDSPDQRKHLRLWAQHWLRKLYGGEGFNEMFLPATAFFTLLFCMDLSPDLQFTATGDIGEDMTEGEVDDDLAEDSDVEDDEVDAGKVATKPSLIKMINFFLPRMAERFSPYRIDKQELQDKLDNLACKDLTNVFSSRSPSSGETFAMMMKRGSVLRHAKSMADTESWHYTRYEGVVQIFKRLDGDNPMDPELAIFGILMMDLLGDLEKGHLFY
ncbi:hypothetical protein DL771_005831 [Monosporascus sp. 5C6A]|nr:hypothetical protein DL771_005831 [Monosporascus sp. 5C6A]